MMIINKSLNKMLLAMGIVTMRMMPFAAAAADKNLATPDYG
jgi:hypothetical protein